MGKDKLERFRIIAERDNVIQFGKPLYENIKGKWRQYFGNNNDIILEIGCGRGEYTTGLANLFPNRNFIGVDIKGARIWKGSTVAMENNLGNAAFLRIQVQLLENFFEENEVNEIWITFPDPRSKGRDEKLRLTSPEFMERYRRILVNGGLINLKTDSNFLFEYTLSVLEEIKSGNSGMQFKNMECTRDLYNSPLLKDHYNIQTTYEKRFLQEGANINYLRFELCK
jgi:tRNA (guanine-N7-)-methyltransferase